jgi:hypothetical protein
MGLPVIYISLLKFLKKGLKILNYPILYLQKLCI